MNDPFLDWESEIEMSNSGCLPHWNQNEKIQYVTFRLADSLPASKVQALTELKNRFIASHPRPWDNSTKTEYWKLISPLESRLLDNGYGSCILRNPDVRRIVSESLWHNNEKQYFLLAYVIMPNHVHLLMQMLDNCPIETTMHSLKSYTSKKINRATRRRGVVWMKEYFDRLVRSEAHLRSCIDYIRSNPRFLPEGDYELYVHDGWR